MKRSKNPRGRDNTGPKINKLLPTPPQANRLAEAKRAATASNMAAASNTEGDNSEILNEIRNMKQGLQQQIQKVGDDVTTIKVSLDSLKADVAKLGSRTSEAEARISQLEDENTQLVNKSQSMENKVTQLQARIEYQENYSRRNNIRIKRVPEETEKGHVGQTYVHEAEDAVFNAISSGVLGHGRREKAQI